MSCSCSSISKDLRILAMSLVSVLILFTIQRLHAQRILATLIRLSMISPPILLTDYFVLFTHVCLWWWQCTAATTQRLWVDSLGSLLLGTLKTPATSHRRVTFNFVAPPLSVATALSLLHDCRRTQTAVGKCSKVSFIWLALTLTVYT